MKKLIIILFVLFSFNLFADNQSVSEKKLIDKISGFILDKQKELRQNGYESEDLGWSSINHVFPNSVTRYDLELVEHNHYIFYTMTDGPPITVCCILPNEAINKKYLIEPLDTMIFYFTPETTATYWFLVFSADNNRGGIHVTYFTRVYKNN